MQHHSNEEVPVDWLSGFFDEVPSCSDSTLGYNNTLPEYTSSSLSYTSLAKSHYLSLNGLSMDSMPSFPEECSNESLYCSTPLAPRTPDYKPLSPDSMESSHSLESDVKPHLFGKDALFEPQENFVPQINSRLEPTELKLFEQNDGQKSLPDSPHSENDSDRPDSESGKKSRYIFSAPLKYLHSCWFPLYGFPPKSAYDSHINNKWDLNHEEGIKFLSGVGKYSSLCFSHGRKFVWLLARAIRKRSLVSGNGDSLKEKKLYRFPAVGKTKQINKPGHKFLRDERC